LWVAIWIGFLGIYAVWEIMTIYDPGLWKIVTVLSIALLVLLARVIPKPAPLAPLPASARPWRYFLTGFLGMTG